MNRLNFIIIYSRRENPFNSHELIQNEFPLMACQHYGSDVIKNK